MDVQEICVSISPHASGKMCKEENLCIISLCSDMCNFLCLTLQPIAPWERNHFWWENGAGERVKFLFFLLLLLQLFFLEKERGKLYTLFEKCANLTQFCLENYYCLGECTDKNPSLYQHAAAAAAETMLSSLLRLTEGENQFLLRLIQPISGIAIFIKLN